MEKIATMPDPQEKFPVVPDPQENIYNILNIDIISLYITTYYM